MSHPIDPVDEFTAAVAVPDPGDRTYPVTVPKALQAFMNRTEWLYKTVRGSFPLSYSAISANSVNGTFGSIMIPPDARMGTQNPWRTAFTRVMHNFVSTRRMVHGLDTAGTELNVPIVFPMGEGNNNWDTVFDAGSTNLPYWRQSTVETAGPATTHPLVWPVIWLPPAGTITKISMLCRANPTTVPSGHHTGLPEFLPRFTLYRVTETSSDALSTEVDASASLSEYEGFHRVETTTFETGIVPYAQYYMVVTGEHGARAIPLSFKIQHVKFTVRE